MVSICDQNKEILDDNGPQLAALSDTDKFSNQYNLCNMEKDQNTMLQCLGAIELVSFG